MPRRATVAAGVLLSLLAPAFAGDLAPDPALTAALHGAQRSAAFVVRDKVRHPGEELAFFSLRPDLSVVEIWPGGGYWTEILAPVLHDHGRYAVAIEPPHEPAAALSATPIAKKLAASPAIYDKVTLGIVGKGRTTIAAPDSVDLIVSFRNVHNWMADGYAPAMFAAFFTALKHGGVLGIEEHRGHRTVAQDPRAADGYVNQDAIVAFATAAGFVLDGTSEMNANPKDTANWPKGVWTLPPSLALGDKDRAMYLAIGEADNAVLRFKKP